MTSPVPVPTGKPIIFYSPHQDDETLFMGHAIAHHALVGREVHVVLCTDGALSQARLVINGERTSWWCSRLHQPAQEGYAPLGLEEFVHARDREFIAACGQLGVWPDNIHIDPMRAPNEALTVTEAQAMILRWADLYPTADHWTMWWDDPHPDHAVLGQARHDLWQSGDPRFGVPRWLVRPEQAALAQAKAYGVPAAFLAVTRDMVRHARYAYESWSPVEGIYGVGGHSVGSTYLAALPNEVNWIVRLP